MEKVLKNLHQLKKKHHLGEFPLLLDLYVLGYPEDHPTSHPKIVGRRVRPERNILANKMGVIGCVGALDKILEEPKNSSLLKRQYQILFKILFGVSHEMAQELLEMEETEYAVEKTLNDYAKLVRGLLDLDSQYPKPFHGWLSRMEDIKAAQQDGTIQTAGLRDKQNCPTITIGLFILAHMEPAKDWLYKITDMQETATRPDSVAQDGLLKEKRCRVIQAAKVAEQTYEALTETLPEDEFQLQLHWSKKSVRTREEWGNRRERQQLLLRKLLGGNLEFSSADRKEEGMTGARKKTRAENQKGEGGVVEGKKAGGTD